MFSQYTYAFVSEPIANLFDSQSCDPGQLFLLLLAGVRAGLVLFKPAVKDGCDSGSEVHTTETGTVQTADGAAATVPDADLDCLC